MSKTYTIKESRFVMRSATAAAVMALIGGEALQLESPNLSKEERRQMVGMTRDVPEDVLSFGSSLIRIMANGYVRTVYAHFVDERCRELFGFGLTMEGDHVVLKRKVSKCASASMGYSYRTDEHGRDMIIGDYAYELNNAYMSLFDRPECVYVPKDDNAFIFFHTARIYLSDLTAMAKWCGDNVIVKNGLVKIEGGKGAE